MSLWTWQLTSWNYTFIYVKPQLKHTMLHFKADLIILSLAHFSLPSPMPPFQWWIETRLSGCSLWNLNFISDRALECLIWSRKDLLQSMLVCTKSRHPVLKVTSDCLSPPTTPPDSHLTVEQCACSPISDKGGVF